MIEKTKWLQKDYDISYQSSAEQGVFHYFEPVFLLSQKFLTNGHVVHHNSKLRFFLD